MKFVILLCLIVLHLFAQDFSFDKEQGKSIPNFVGEITLFRGEVIKVSKNGKEEKTQVGTRFFQNDMIKTKDKSFAKIKVVDDTVISLGPNSELNFSQFEFVDKTDRKAVYSFIKGQLRGHFKNKAEEGDLTIKTKSAAMGIRGTEILLNYQEKDFKQISDFVLLSGHAVVFDDKLSEHEIKESQRITTVHDSRSNKSANDRESLSSENLKYLQSVDSDEAKDFKPFLAFYDPQKAKKKSNIYKFYFGDSKTQNNDQPSSVHTERDEQDDTTWKNNLNKLNQKLKESNY